MKDRQIAFEIFELPIDTSKTDIAAISEFTHSLPGSWHSKALRKTLRTGLKWVSWICVFRTAPATEIPFSITITRTTVGYRVVSWDLMKYYTEDGFPEYRVSTIDEVVEVLRTVVQELDDARRGVVRTVR